MFYQPSVTAYFMSSDQTFIAYIKFCYVFFHTGLEGRMISKSFWQVLKLAHSGILLTSEKVSKILPQGS